jgi:hypothetical protein
MFIFVGDGKTLILEYKEGNSACSHTKRRSDNTAAKVIIKFECGNTVGGPVYVSGLVINLILCYSSPSPSYKAPPSKDHFSC